MTALTPRRGYLHTSPEFAMKKLLAAGEEKIFTFSRVWRNREGGPRHRVEFTMLEWYRANEGYETLMDDCAAILSSPPTPPVSASSATATPPATPAPARAAPPSLPRPCATASTFWRPFPAARPTRPPSPRRWRIRRHRHRPRRHAGPTSSPVS
jgi:hypothetical protein